MGTTFKSGKEMAMTGAGWDLPFICCAKDIASNPHCPKEFLITGINPSNGLCSFRKLQRLYKNFKMRKSTFLSHISFGGSISTDIAPPVYFRTSCLVALIISVSLEALWSIHMMMLHSGKPEY